MTSSILSLTERPATDWVEDAIYASESRGRFKAYLGSMPYRKNIPTQGEIQREDELTVRTSRLRLVQTIVLDPMRDRRFFFVSTRNFLESLDYRPNVTSLVFGELTTEDSVGYLSGEPMLIQGTHGWIPMELIERASFYRLPKPGTRYGACEDMACGHERCAETRLIADSPCTECKSPIGYETEYVAYRYLRGERPQVLTRQEVLAVCPMKYTHASCIYDDTEDILNEPHPFGGKLQTSYIPPVNRSEVAA